MRCSACLLSLGAGQFLTLLGPSGSGKTTTPMMIAGFVEPTSGEIHRQWPFGDASGRLASVTWAWCSQAMPCFLI